MYIPIEVKPEVEISQVITCYNEQDYIVPTIEEVVAALETVGRSYEVLVIDDVSQDDSVKRVRDYIKDHPQYPVRLKANKKNRGLANNYVEGAFLCTGKYYRLCCGDNPQPREAMIKIFKHVGQADLIIPYQNQDSIPGRSFYRRFLSRAFVAIVNLTSGYQIKYYNGLAVQLRYNVMRWPSISYGFGFQADIITHLLDEGATYMQVFTSGEVEHKGADSTAMSLRNLLSVMHSLLEILIRRIRRIMFGRNWPKAREIFPDQEN